MEVLAAIGIRETSFINTTQSGRKGVGVFQIDLGKNPSVTSEDASNLVWAGDWAATTLDFNKSALSNAFPTLTSTDLTAAAIASWNHGLAGVSEDLRNGWPIDAFTTGSNYRANVMDLTDCFE